MSSVGTRHISACGFLMLYKNNSGSHEFSTLFHDLSIEAHFVIVTRDHMLTGTCAKYVILLK